MNRKYESSRRLSYFVLGCEPASFIELTESHDLGRIVGRMSFREGGWIIAHTTA